MGAPSEIPQEVMQTVMQPALKNTVTWLWTEHNVTMLALMVAGLVVGSIMMQWVKVFYPSLDDAPVKEADQRHKNHTKIAMLLGLVWTLIIMTAYLQIALEVNFFIALTVAFGGGLVSGGLTPVAFKGFKRAGKILGALGWLMVKNRLKKEGATPEQIEELDKTVTKFQKPKDGGGGK